jgi:hypothetical protein
VPGRIGPENVVQHALFGVSWFNTWCNRRAFPPWQAGYGGNRLADLDAGLDIIQEAFTNYQTAVANGQAPSHAFNSLKQVLNRAIGAWAQEFKQVCNQIRVGH